MTLRISEMPCSFTGQALCFLNTNNTLEYATGREVGFTFSFYNVADFIGNSLFRVVYYVGITILGAPLGVVYHSGSALWCKARSFSTNVTAEQTKQAALAWEHCKAAATDISGIGVTAVGFFYMATNSSYEQYLKWWYSSTQVAIDNPPQNNPHLGISRQALHLIATHWGSLETRVPRFCSYEKLTLRSIQRWKDQIGPHQPVALDDPGIIHEIFRSCWAEETESAQYWAGFRPKCPPFRAEHYKLPQAQQNPSYGFPWKTIAWTLASIGLIILTAGYVALVKLNAMDGYNSSSGRSNPIQGFVGCLGLIAWAIQEAVKARTENLGSAENELGNQLMDAVANDTSGTCNLGKVQQALLWHHTAGSRGYGSAQRRFGLGLLASLSQHQSAATMDVDELMLVKEAIQWLQAAAINGDVNAPKDLCRLFGMDVPPGNQQVAPPQLVQRLYAGVTGNTESDRVRNLFPAGHNFIQIAIEQYASIEQNATKREKIRTALLAARRKPTTEPVAETTQLPTDIADLIAQFTVGA